jgi:hypothetical protein
LDEKEGSLSNSVMLLLAIQKVLASAARSSHFSGSDLQTIAALENMISKYINRKLPLMKNRLDNQESVDFRGMYEENLIPEELVHILLS